MKKKVEVKPTKVSRHNAPYTFQQKSISLHPLGGKTQNIKQYQPNSYVMGHTSTMSISSSQNVLQSRTYTPHGGQLNENTSYESAYGSTLQEDSVASTMDGGGLSTDGFEIYETDVQFPPEPKPVEDLAAKQAVNNNRAKMVKSAPAAFPGDGRRMSIADFAKGIAELEKPVHLQNLEEDADLQWLVVASTAPSDNTAAAPAQRVGVRAKSALPAMVSFVCYRVSFVCNSFLRSHFCCRTPPGSSVPRGAL